MCYVKVKRASQKAKTQTHQTGLSNQFAATARATLAAVAAANPSLLKDLSCSDPFLCLPPSTDSVSIDGVDPFDPLDASVWLESPLQFDTAAFSATPAAGEDWMAWLEGMSGLNEASSETPETDQTQTQLMPHLAAFEPKPEIDSFAIPSLPCFNPISPPLSSTNSSPRFGRVSTPSSQPPSKKRPHPSSSDDSDDAAAKRSKNTEAARKSRARKAAKVDDLEHKLDMLEDTNSKLCTRIAVLESDAGSFAEREAALKRRIAMLEAQLSDSHRALIAQTL
ncbi:hypothetical protein BC830DRAFT_1080263 [Chytriomyces sp. MP71]|nr:hypothetical protein BC830DRAFT_1080263 [Chytriomyces sp. MP71]